MADLYDRGTNNGILPYKPAMELRAFLARRLVFSLDDFRRSFPELTPEAAKKRLLRAAERGEIRSVGRALYAVVPGDQSPGKHQADPFQLLNARVPDAIFCGHSALELNGLAYSTWNEVTAYTQGNRETFQREGIKFRFLVQPKRLSNVAMPNLGIRQVDRQGIILTTLGPERTLVEGFRSPGPFGGLSEFLASVDHIERVKENILIETLQAFNEKKLYACLGWFLESRQESLRISTTFFDECRNHEPKTPVYLSRKMGSVAKVKGWSLLVPELLNRMEQDLASQF